MKLAVLGATGGTGLQIVRQAADHGHSVTAFVRNTAPLNGFRDRINIVKGDLLNSSELERAIAGQDAVLSAFGHRVPVVKSDRNLMRDFAAALTRAMSWARVRRVVAVSVAFLFKDSIMPPAYLFGRLLFPRVVADAAAMERVFESSGADWTIVRPPRLTDKAPTGRYRVRERHLPPFGFTISRSDVAEFVISAVQDRTRLEKSLESAIKDVKPCKKEGVENDRVFLGAIRASCICVGVGCGTEF